MATRKRPPDKENDFGANIGGPMLFPGFHGPNSLYKGYFYFNWEGFQDHGGAELLDFCRSLRPRPAPATSAAGAASCSTPTIRRSTERWLARSMPSAGNQIDPEFQDPIAQGLDGRAADTDESAERQNNYFVPKSGQGSLTNSENV